MHGWVTGIPTPTEGVPYWQGVIRESVFAHYFGNSDAAGAFRAAFRIPNLLQSLLGEAVETGRDEIDQVRSK